MFLPFDELMNKVRTVGRERGIMVRLTSTVILFYFFYTQNGYLNYLPLQLCPELIEAGARIYITKQRKKEGMIIYNKVTSKQ